MPNDKKPRKVLERSGAFRKDPNRDRDPNPEGKGELDTTPPEDFDAPLIKIWDELVEQIPEGVATNSDRIHIELTAKMVHQSRTQEVNAAWLSQMSRMLKAIGLTPAGRANLGVTGPKKPNKFADL